MDKNRETENARFASSENVKILLHCLTQWGFLLDIKYNTQVKTQVWRQMNGMASDERSGCFQLAGLHLLQAFEQGKIWKEKGNILRHSLRSSYGRTMVQFAHKPWCGPTMSIFLGPLRILINPYIWFNTAMTVLQKLSQQSEADHSFS